MRNEIWFAHAVYTGGNIWVFYGKLKDGTFFLMDSDGDAMLLNADPSDFDESLFGSWQKNHLIRELTGSERIAFRDDVLDKVIGDGGFTEYDAKRHRESFADIDRYDTEENRYHGIAERLWEMGSEGCDISEAEEAIQIRRLTNVIRQVDKMDGINGAMLVYAIEAVTG